MKNINVKNSKFNLILFTFYGVLGLIFFIVEINRAPNMVVLTRNLSWFSSFILWIVLNFHTSHDSKKSIYNIFQWLFFLFFLIFYLTYFLTFAFNAQPVTNNLIISILIFIISLIMFIFDRLGNNRFKTVLSVILLFSVFILIIGYRIIYKLWVAWSKIL